MICQEDHDQILADPKATHDELRAIIAELQAELAAPLPDEVRAMADVLRGDPSFSVLSAAADMLERLARAAK